MMRSRPGTRAADPAKRFHRRPGRAPERDVEDADSLRRETVEQGGEQRSPSSGGSRCKTK
jgi:hypothetical protein